MPVIQRYPHCKSHSAQTPYLWNTADKGSLYGSAQGAAQAIEDGAVLGELFARMQNKSQIKDIIHMYEAIRKPRTSRVIAGSNARRDIYQMRDGEAQQKRDHELRQEHSSDRYPRCIEDPGFQSWLLDYDTEAAVERAWQQYQAVATKSKEGNGFIGETFNIDL